MYLRHTGMREEMTGKKVTEKTGHKDAQVLI